MTSSTTTHQTGAQLMVRILEAQGVTHVFGVPGAKIDGVFNALVDSSIKTVVCRHEQNAAFIAGGIGRMTGRAGVAIVTSGPGVSNLVTGLATANSEGDPMVAIGGSVATDEALKQLHQTMDSVAVCKPVTKFSAVAGTPASLPEVMANAFRSAEGGRPGAAFVSLPKDVASAPSDHRVLPLPARSGAGPADRRAIEASLELINTAKNPVVLLGLLASRPANAESVRTFIERGHLPVVGTFQSSGAVSAHLFNSFGGRVGQLANQPGDHLLESADLVITVGYDPVEYPPSEWNRGAARKIIHVDALAADLDNHYCPEVELVGDIAQSLDAVGPSVRRSKLSPAATRILETISTQRSQLDHESASRSGTPIHPLRLVHELQQILRPDMTLCLDMGSFHLWLARHLYSFRARQILISNGQQTLGVALPWAIAASIVRPGEKVLSISGDGGFLYSGMELETAVRLKANIVHMIWIDGTYDMVGVQEQLKYGRKSGVDLGPVDPVLYARAFGATGLMINTPDEVRPTLEKAFDTAGPVIIGVKVDYRDNHKLFEMVRENSIQ